MTAVFDGQLNASHSVFSIPGLQYHECTKVAMHYSSTLLHPLSFATDKEKDSDKAFHKLGISEIASEIKSNRNPHSFNYLPLYTLHCRTHMPPS